MSGSSLPIYLDHHATTPVDDRVRDVMIPYLTRDFGNPASRTHVFGRMADHAIEVARHQVAALIGASDPDDIHFTSGATESNRIALMGVAASAPRERRQIITSVVEHQSVLEVCALLEQQGFEITQLPVSPAGIVQPEHVAAAMSPRTLLVSIMHVQNVVGSVQPIAQIAALTRSRGVLLHVDAAQGLGLVPFDVDALGVDLAAFSAHKLYGPKGVGAIYLRRAHRGERARWVPRGTPNVAGIVGFGRAAEIMSGEGAAEAERLRGLRERMKQRLAERLADAGLEMHLHGSHEHSHPGNLNLSIPVLDSVALAELRTRVALSHGSACASSSHQASHVLLSMGISDELARTALRIGIGRFNTDEDIEHAAEQIARAARASAGAVTDPSRRRKVIINCEGRRVPLPEGPSTAMCAVSGPDEFLSRLGQYAVPALCALGKPPRINIVIPSHCSGPKLGTTLLSLLSQTYGLFADLIVFVNEPPDAPAKVTRANDATEAWLRGLIGQAPRRPDDGEHDQAIRAALEGLQGRVRLHCIRHALADGINGAYQAVLSSFVERVRQYGDEVGRDGRDRRRLMDELERRTMLLFCDDDLELATPDALMSAYYHATVHDAVILGQWQVRRPTGAGPWDGPLADVMQLFLDMKHEVGANALSPKGLLLRHVFEIGGLDFNLDFADQLYFAKLALERPVHLVPAHATIEEASYPSNGRSLRDLRRYVQGEPDGSLSILFNLLEIMRPEGQRYSRCDVAELIEALETRAPAAVEAVTRRLLARRAAPPALTVVNERRS